MGGDWKEWVEAACAASKLCVVEQARGIFLKWSSCWLFSFAFSFLIPAPGSVRPRLPIRNEWRAKGRRGRRIDYRRDAEAQRCERPRPRSSPAGQHGALTPVAFLRRRVGRVRDRRLESHHGGRHGTSRPRRVIALLILAERGRVRLKMIGEPSHAADVFFFGGSLEVFEFDKVAEFCDGRAIDIHRGQRMSPDQK